MLLASGMPKALLKIRLRPGFTPLKQCCPPACSQSAVTPPMIARPQATSVKAFKRPCHLGAQKTQSESATDITATAPTADRGGVRTALDNEMGADHGRVTWHVGDDFVDR